MAGENGGQGGAQGQGAEGQQQGTNGQGGAQGQGAQASNPFTAPKRPDDPVKVKCVKVSGEGAEKVKELKFAWRGDQYAIPVGGETKRSMPREAAEFLLQRSARYWSLKAELQILEPTFK